MNPYNHNPFETDTSRDTRSEYVANRELNPNEVNNNVRTRRYNLNSRDRLANPVNPLRFQ